MTKAVTDSKLSLSSEEFIWASEGESESHSYLLPEVLDFVKHKGVGSVFDIGSGNGYVLHRLQEQGCTVAGFDFSHTGVEIANNTYEQINVFTHDIEKPLLKYHPEYDLVISLEVIEHLLRPRSLFYRADEVLAEDGYLLISTPYHGYLKNLVLAAFNLFDDHWHPLRDYGHIKFFSKKTILALFEENGFEVVDFKRVGRRIPFLEKSMVIVGKRR